MSGHGNLFMRGTQQLSTSRSTREWTHILCGTTADYREHTKGMTDAHGRGGGESTHTQGAVFSLVNRSAGHVLGSSLCGWVHDDVRWLMRIHAIFRTGRDAIGLLLYEGHIDGDQSGQMLFLVIS